jgi:diguanylate cyclase (GGDEF)-like protein
VTLLEITLAAARESTLARGLNRFRQEVERLRPRLAWAFLVREGSLWRCYLCRVGADFAPALRRDLAECAGAPTRDAAEPDQGGWLSLPGPRGRQTPRRCYAVHEQTALALTQDDPEFRAAFTLLVHHFRQRDDAAGTDFLTGLANRQGFDLALRQLLHLQQRRRFDFTLGLLDLDGFKKLNDREGHARGDACLIELALQLSGAVRESDTVARLGGDEFALLFPYAGAEALAVLRARVRGALDHLDACTGSMGLLAVPATRPLPAVAPLLELADRVLYRAKAQAPGGVAEAIWPEG